MEIYPQFETVPYKALQMYHRQAEGIIQERRYHQYYEEAMGLWMAHHCTLYNMGKDAVNGAGATGSVTSKSVDGVSVSYDVNGINGDFNGAGTFKLTLYGQRLLTIVRIVGKGGMQIW